MGGGEVRSDRGDRREKDEPDDRPDTEHDGAEPTSQGPEASRRTSVSRCAADAAGGNLVSVPVRGPLEKGHVTPLTHGGPALIWEGYFVGAEGFRCTDTW